MSRLNFRDLVNWLICHTVMVALLLLLFLLHLLMVSAIGAMFSLVICFVSLNSENHSTRLLSLFAVRLPFFYLPQKALLSPAWVKVPNFKIQYESASKFWIKQIIIVSQIFLPRFEMQMMI